MMSQSANRPSRTRISTDAQSTRPAPQVQPMNCSAAEALVFSDGVRPRRDRSWHGQGKSPWPRLRSAARVQAPSCVTMRLLRTRVAARRYVVFEEAIDGFPQFDVTSRARHVPLNYGKEVELACAEGPN